MKTFINDSSFYVLDIETGVASTREDRIPDITWLCYGYLSKYDTKGHRLNTFFFREWSDLHKQLNFINKSRYKNIIYVHNLAFEGDFLHKNIANVSDILSNSNHHFITLSLIDLDKIEFRCSYTLSGKSLRELGKDIGLKKLEDEYYSYLPCEEIPKKSMRYCQRDCDIVAKYIATVIKEYKRLSNVPLSKTGRVRKTFKEYYRIMEQDCDWDRFPEEDCYKLINDSFSGAITITNPKWTGMVIKNVHSYDMTSAYPSRCFLNTFPVNFYKVNYDRLSEYKKHKHFIIKCKFKNIRSKYDWGWLSTSKCKYETETINAAVFNGKIIKVNNNWITITITDVDLETINMSYKYDDFEIIEGCVSDEDRKLPDCYIKTLEHYATNKYECKKRWKENPTHENELLLMSAKGDFNSIYGMMVQKIVQEEFKIDECGVWEKVELNYKKEKGHMKRNFIFGSYITAYNRKALVEAIITNCPETFVYADTDSIKFFGENKFIDNTPELTEYKENKAIYGLGKFDYEKTYSQFKTYGAKKYCYVIDNKCEYVVAGLPKDAFKIKINKFKLDTVFKDCKNASVYLNHNYDKIKLTDEGMKFDEIENTNTNKIAKFLKDNKIKSNGGVALFPVSYILNMTENDIKYIKENYNRVVE